MPDLKALRDGVDRIAAVQNNVAACGIASRLKAPGNHLNRVVVQDGNATGQHDMTLSQNGECSGGSAAPAVDAGIDEDVTVTRTSVETGWGAEGVDEDIAAAIERRRNCGGGGVSNQRVVINGDIGRVKEPRSMAIGRGAGVNPDALKR